MTIDDKIVARRAKCIGCGKVFGKTPGIEEEYYTTAVCTPVVAKGYICDRCGSNVFEVQLDIDAEIKSI